MGSATLNPTYGLEELIGKISSGCMQVTDIARIAAEAAQAYADPQAFLAANPDINYDDSFPIPLGEWVVVGSLPDTVLFQADSYDALFQQIVDSFGPGVNFVLKPKQLAKTEPLKALNRIQVQLSSLSPETQGYVLVNFSEPLDDELQAAEAMQISLLKSDEDVAAIASPRGADLWTFYKASNRLGGDLWQVFEIDETRFGLFMVDLSGHGVAAAINAFRVHMLTDALSRHRSRPASFLAAVNDYLCQMLPVEHFATAFYGVVDPSVGKMDYAIAGAPAPIVLQASGGWQALEGSGLILGCAPKTDYEAYEVDLERGDRVLCYSDGLYENFERPELSLEPADIARLACELLPVERGPGFLPALIERLFEGPDAQSQDDLTLLFLEVRGHG